MYCTYIHTMIISLSTPTMRLSYARMNHVNTDEKNLWGRFPTVLKRSQMGLHCDPPLLLLL